MQISKWQLFHHAPRLFELEFGLAGKADHHIRPDRGVRHSSAYFLDLFLVMPRTIFATHTPQNGIASRLHRNVGVLGYAGRLGDQTNQLIAPVHRLDGAEAEFLKRGLLEETSDEINKSLRCSLLSH